MSTRASLLLERNPFRQARLYAVSLMMPGRCSRLPLGVLCGQLLVAWAAAGAERDDVVGAGDSAPRGSPARSSLMTSTESSSKCSMSDLHAAHGRSTANLPDRITLTPWSTSASSSSCNQRVRPANASKVSTTTKGRSAFKCATRRGIGQLASRPVMIDQNVGGGRWCRGGYSVPP